MSFVYSSISSKDVYLQDNIVLNGITGNEGYAISSSSGATVWKQITGLVSQYVDTTNDSQDMNTGSVVQVTFDTELINAANITFSGGNTFTFNDPGIYMLSFQCLLSSSNAQTMMSFSLNGTQVYGNLSTRTGSGDYVPMILQYTLNINQGDYVQVLGEKYTDGPNYLKNNPIYSNPITQFTITKM